jgi:hypothetical protein
MREDGDKTQADKQHGRQDDGGVVVVGADARHVRVLPVPVASGVR